MSRRYLYNAGMCHAHTTDVCLEYFEKMRRQVYQTPKSYLSFIAAYQVMYGDSASEVELWDDGVHATSRHCDAVFMIMRASPRRVNVQRPCRDGLDAGTRRNWPK